MHPLRPTLERLITSRTLRVVATLVLVAVIVWRSQPQHLVSAAGRLGPSSIVVAALLTLPFLYFKTLRWLYILRFGGSEARFADAAISLLGGMGIALLTPARVGEVARIAYLRDNRKLRLSGLVLLDKFFDVEVLVLLSAIGAWEIISWGLGALLLLMGVAGLVFAFFPRVFRRPIELIERRMPFGGRTKEVFSALDSLSPPATILYLVLTVAAFAIVILQFGVILHGATNVSPRIALLTFPLVILTNIVPLTIAGLGLREGASILLLGHFHVNAALAAISAFTMFFLNTALPGLAGAFVPLFHGPRPSPEAQVIVNKS